MLANSYFGPTPPERLGWVRLIVGGFCIYWLWIHFGLVADMAHYDPGMFKPRGAAVVLPGMLSPTAIWALYGVNMGLAVAFTLGWRYRLTGPLFAVLFLLLTSYRTSWTMLYHSDNLMTLQVLVLGLAPQVGEVVSLDVLAGRKRDRESWEWMWPLALVCTVTVITYWLAGLSKVWGPAGWSWAIGDNLRNQVAYDTLNKELLGNYAPSMARFFFDYPWVLVPGSIIALGVEVFAPVALLDRTAGAIWAFLTLCMHWGIWFIMHIGFIFPLYGFAFAAFLPVERPLGWVKMMLERQWMQRQLATATRTRT